jgi:hypothetical protein
MRFAVIHELIEQRQAHALKPLTLAQAPILIPAFEQVALVKLDGLMKQLRSLVSQLAAFNALNEGRCLLERFYI